MSAGGLLARDWRTRLVRRCVIDLAGLHVRARRRCGRREGEQGDDAADDGDANERPDRAGSQDAGAFALEGHRLIYPEG